MRSWRVNDCSSGHVELLLDAEDSQPVKYQGSQIIRLGNQSVSIKIKITNDDTIRAPFGMGIHPYFVRTSDTILSCRLDRQWELDTELMPISNSANDLNVKMQNGILVRDLPESGAFHSMSTDARISWPSTGLRIDIESSPPMQHAIIWCPGGRDFFCYEPVSHMVDGFNMQRAGVNDAGVQYLKPGQSFEVCWSFFASAECRIAS